MKEMFKESQFAALFCSDCLKDKSIQCKRDMDALCLHCNRGLCAHHILEHLKREHCVSVEWRGFQFIESEVKK